MHDERGSGSIEMLLVMLILLPLVFGGLEFARAASLKHSLGVGAWAAARHLSLDPWDESGAEDLVRQAVANALGGDPDAVRVTFTFDSPTRSFGSRLTVHAEMDYQALVPFLNLAPRTLAGECTLTVEAWP